MTPEDTRSETGATRVTESTAANPKASVCRDMNDVRELRSNEFALADTAWLEYHDTSGDPSRDRIFALFCEGKLVSLARCRRHPDGLEVDGVFTLPAYRGHGCSSAVMAALTEACHNDELFMYAISTLTGFYSRFGFEPIPENSLPQSVQERYRWASGNLEGVQVLPMRRKPGWQPGRA